MPNDVLPLFETSIKIALSQQPILQYKDSDSPFHDIFDDERAILNDESIREDRREAFAQLTRLKWAALFVTYEERTETEYYEITKVGKPML